MPSITADFQERKRVVFTSRGRSLVNVRQSLDDGPIGFTSVELLLIALGNCSLGSLLNHPLLKDEPVYEASAQLNADTGDDPARVTSVHWEIRLVVEDESLVPYSQELAQAALSGPACNSVGAGLTANVSIWTQKDIGLRPPPLQTIEDGASCVVEFALPAERLPGASA